MGKLHELLAVEGSLKGVSDKLVAEATSTFKKPEHFSGYDKLLIMFKDEDQQGVIGAEHREIVTTVHAKLDYVSETVGRYFDALLQKEKTNQQAVADVVVDGIAIVNNAPATYLLNMESRLNELRVMYDAIPTLAPGISWEEDTTIGKGVYKTKYPEETIKTAKAFKHHVLVPPTDKHPAQVEKWEEQVATGKWQTTKYSGMLTPAEKSLIIGRLDKLIMSIKKARQQANCQEIVQDEIGAKIFSYIHGV
jgi:hypothetical protein